MSVLIVHQFETVEIEKQDRHWIAIAIGAVDLAVCGLQQVAYVVDLRHIIDERSVLRLVVSLGVAKSESGVSGDQLRAIEFSGPEGSTVFEQPQDADLLVATAHRNRSHRSALDSDIAKGIVKWPFGEDFDARNRIDVDRLVADQNVPKGPRLQF